MSYEFQEVDAGGVDYYGNSENSTQSDFNAQTITGGVTARSDDTIGVDRETGSTVDAPQDAPDTVDDGTDGEVRTTLELKKTVSGFIIDFFEQTEHGLDVDLFDSDLNLVDSNTWNGEPMVFTGDVGDSGDQLRLTVYATPDKDLSLIDEENHDFPHTSDDFDITGANFNSLTMDEYPLIEYATAITSVDDPGEYTSQHIAKGPVDLTASFSEISGGNVGLEWIVDGSTVRQETVESATTVTESLELSSASAVETSVSFGDGGGGHKQYLSSEGVNLDDSTEDTTDSVLVEANSSGYSAHVSDGSNWYGLTAIPDSEDLQWYDETDGEFTDFLDEHDEVWVAEYERTFTDSGSDEGFIEFYLESETVFEETYSATSSFHTDVEEWVDDFDSSSPSGAQTDEELFLAGV